MNITALPWGIFCHNSQSREIHERWFRFAGNNPDIEGVDLMDGEQTLFGTPARQKESREFQAILNGLGLKVVMFVSHADLRVEEVPAQEQDRLKYLIEQAVYFKAKYFRVITGLQKPGELFQAGIMENVFHWLNWCLDLTDDAGLPLLLENHHETTDELVTICEVFKKRGLRMNCEVKPPFRYNMNPNTFVGRLIPFAETYHLDNFSYHPDGRDSDRTGRNLERAVSLQNGEIDIRSMLSMIKSSGFNGWLSIEYGGYADKFEHIAESASFVRKVWG